MEQHNIANVNLVLCFSYKLRTYDTLASQQMLGNEMCGTGSSLSLYNEENANLPGVRKKALRFVLQLKVPCRQVTVTTGCGGSMKQQVRSDSHVVLM